MKKVLILWLLLPVLSVAQIPLNTMAEPDTVQMNKKESTPNDSLYFKGQASIWALYNHSNDLPLWAGLQYIPQVNYDLTYLKNRLLDFEVALNVNGSAGFKPLSANETQGNAKLYRSWVRYSTNQLEVRAGLQKINFGSASLLRPLMWFDRIDPRDPLQLTEGVWGLLARYYFLNNVNVWAWTLYGNKEPAVWEVLNTNHHIPEFGGRIQSPLPKGEIGLSYHRRTAELGEYSGYLDSILSSINKIPENKVGLDAKWDMEVGLWFEASWTNKERDLNILTNQHLLNLGIDYTFALGNGVNVILEHLIISQDKKPFLLEKPVNFSAVSVSYPMGMFDNLNAIFYYDHLNKSVYNFLSWKKQFNHFSFYSMVYLNPTNNMLPLSDEGRNLMGGKGIQFMIVYNH